MGKYQVCKYQVWRDDGNDRRCLAQIEADSTEKVLAYVEDEFLPEPSKHLFIDEDGLFGWEISERGELAEFGLTPEDVGENLCEGLPTMFWLDTISIYVEEMESFDSWKPTPYSI